MARSILPSGIRQASDPAQSADHPAAPSQTQLENSQNAIRDTTKWLVAAAAAVGAVVVAGLQLSKLPTGTLATVVALAGFVIALLGVAVVLFSAAEVLSAGYTTLGQLADLYDFETIRKEKEMSWDGRIESLEASATQLARRLSLRGFFMQRRIRIEVNYLKMIRPLRIHFAKENGVRVAEMIAFLERDALIFSNFLAATIPELYGRIKTTDEDILRLRGEEPALSERAVEPDAGQGRHRVSRPARGTQRITRSIKAASQSSQNFRASRLAAAEWRAAQLEMAAGQLIAFANQLVIERRFRVLKRSVQYGGIAVLLGVGLFALAPKLAQQIPLSVTAPTRVTIEVKTPSKFGKYCALRQLSGIAIGGNWDEPIIVTEKSGYCLVTRITLKSSIGLAVPAVTP